MPNMKSLLSQLLFETVMLPTKTGRKICFDVDEPDIQVATGPLDERIALLMQMRGFPMTAREIAVGIASKASQLNIGEKELMGRNAQDIEVRRGMTATVDIKSGDRSVLSCLLKPMTKTLGSSFGER